MSYTLKVAERTQTYVFASYGSLSISAWCAPGTVPALYRSVQVSQELYEKYPEGTSTLIVLRDLTPPDDEARAVGRNLLAEDKSIQIGRSFLLRGSGLRVSAMRMVLTGLNIFNTRCPTKVHKELDEALDWLAALPKQYAEFRSALPEMKRAISDLIDVEPFAVPTRGSS